MAAVPDVQSTLATAQLMIMEPNPDIVYTNLEKMFEVREERMS